MQLVERAKRIVLQPKEEWQAIDGEATSVGALYAGYIMPLAAIGPAASLIGWSVFGMPVPFLGTVRVPIMKALTGSIVTYVLALVGVFVLALIIDALAPTFGGTKSQIQALKVAAYSSTAAWLAGIFTLVPALSILGILGLYSLYLLYLGLPILMRAPAEKALGYTVVVIISAIILYLLIAAVSSRFIM